MVDWKELKLWHKGAIIGFLFSLFISGYHKIKFGDYHAPVPFFSFGDSILDLIVGTLNFIPVALIAMFHISSDLSFNFRTIIFISLWYTAIGILLSFLYGFIYNRIRNKKAVFLVFLFSLLAMVVIIGTVAAFLLLVVAASIG